MQQAPQAAGKGTPLAHACPPALHPPPPLADMLHAPCAASTSGHQQIHLPTCHALQGKHGTREWDLNDPTTLRQSSPARVSDADPRCGPSGMQRFAGEDLSKAAREAAQQAQCDAWWRAQLAEKEAARLAEVEERRRVAGMINMQVGGGGCMTACAGGVEALVRHIAQAAGHHSMWHGSTESHSTVCKGRTAAPVSTPSSCRCKPSQGSAHWQCNRQPKQPPISSPAAVSVRRTRCSCRRQPRSTARGAR